MECCVKPLSRFHVLATVAFLAIPGEAFADDMRLCALSCAQEFGIDNSSYWGCVAGCCNVDDPGDSNCCSTYCDPDDPNCVAGCESALTTCIPGDCNTLACIDLPCVTKTDNCKQSTNKADCGACKCKENTGGTSCVCGS
jgi:hypothetical protein